MINAIELKDMELDMINGGDYGDADKDTGDEPRYKVGQYVEVYNSPFHATTTRTKILSVKKAKSGHWQYEVDMRMFWARTGSPDPMDIALSANRNNKINADYIQSN